MPAVGRVLDIGCGHGLFSIYLGLMSPDRDVLGVDIDARKLVIARGAASGAGAERDVRRGRRRRVPDGASGTPSSWPMCSTS